MSGARGKGKVFPGGGNNMSKDPVVGDKLGIFEEHEEPDGRAESGRR